MQVKLEIDFEQLVEAVKSLPSNQLGQLMAEIEKKNRNPKSRNELKNMLLNGPVATKKQLETIENNRKAINQWRTN